MARSKARTKPCGIRTVFATKKEADKQAVKYMELHRKALFPYKCKNCKQYHLSVYLNKWEKL